MDVNSLNSSNSYFVGVREEHYLERAKRILAERRKARTLPDRVADWPESLQGLYEERVSKWVERGHSLRRALRGAEDEIRRAWVWEIRQMWASSQ